MAEHVLQPPVSREVLRDAVRDLQARNADIDRDEIEKLIDIELAAVRDSFWPDWRAN